MIDVARHAEPGREHRRAPVDELLRVGEHPVGQRGEEVDAERLVGERLGGADLVDHLVGRHRRGAEAAEAARLGHRGDERVVRDAAHPGEHHGVLDAEQSVSRVRMGAHRSAGVPECPLTSCRVSTGTPLVGVIMGSDSDLPVMQGAIDVLAEFGVPYEVRIVSAHRTPDVMYEYARTAADRGLRVIIAGAGGAAHLPGMTASMTPLPVIGVPVPLEHLDGLDSLLSIVQMPAGIPVATVAVGNARTRACSRCASSPRPTASCRTRWTSSRPTSPATCREGRHVRDQ